MKSDFGTKKGAAITKGSERKAESCGESFHLLREYRNREHSMAIVVTPKMTRNVLLHNRPKGRAAK